MQEISYYGEGDKGLEWLRAMFENAPPGNVGLKPKPGYIDLTPEEIEEFKQFCPLAKHLTNITEVKLINPSINQYNMYDNPVTEVWVRGKEPNANPKLKDWHCAGDSDCEAWEEADHYKAVYEEVDSAGTKTGRKVYKRPEEGPGTEIIENQGYYYGPSIRTYQRLGVKGNGEHRDTLNNLGFTESQLKHGEMFLVAFQGKNMAHFGTSPDTASTGIPPRNQSIYGPQPWTLLSIEDGITALHSEPVGHVDAGRLVLGFVCPGARLGSKDRELFQMLKEHYTIDPYYLLDYDLLNPKDGVPTHKHNKVLVAVVTSIGYPYIVTDKERQEEKLTMQHETGFVTAYYGDVTRGWSTYTTGKPKLQTAFADISGRPPSNQPTKPS